MSDDEINEAIAAHCGWDFDPEWAHEWDSRGRWVEEPETKQRKFRHAVPRYTHDLNAMHEAERSLDAISKWVGDENASCAEEAYMDWLARVVTSSDGKFADDWQLCHATARQRAEAFLRTINKWKE
jgi:hypothetical protein